MIVVEQHGRIVKSLPTRERVPGYARLFSFLNKIVLLIHAVNKPNHTVNYNNGLQATELLPENHKDNIILHRASMKKQLVPFESQSTYHQILYTFHHKVNFHPSPSLTSSFQKSVSRRMREAVNSHTPSSRTRFQR